MATHLGYAGKCRSTKMPRLNITEGASHGLERCRQFLEEKNAAPSLHAGTAIAQAFQNLQVSPDMGRPWMDSLALCELIIGFGSAGYIALNRNEPDHDAVYVLAFKRQKEAGF
jgi:plasmid stabilization system protein ParE